jgi:predicted RecA/RadA family phage recombinase
MKNYVQDGEVLDLTAPYAVASGGGALIGKIFGVAKSTVANAAVGQFQTEGVVDLAKTAAQTFAQGAFVYWDNATKLATSTAASNTLIGTAVLAAAGADANVRLKLLPIVA